MEQRNEGVKEQKNEGDKKEQKNEGGMRKKEMKWEWKRTEEMKGMKRK